MEENVGPAFVDLLCVSKLRRVPSSVESAAVTIFKYSISFERNLCLPLHVSLGPAKYRTGSREKPSDLERTADAQTRGSHYQVVEKTGGLRERRKE